MKKWCLGLVLLTSMAGFGQDFDLNGFIDKIGRPIQCDRPGQCLNAKTAGALTAQVQTGFNFSKYRYNIGSSFESHINNNVVPVDIRFGILPKLEINTSFSYVNSKYEDEFFSTSSSGFPSPNLGLRYEVVQGSSWKPHMALQANLSFLSHNGTFQQNNFGSSFYVITSNRFEKFSLNSTLGMVFRGDGGNSPIYTYVLNAGYSINDKFGVFVEGFGQFNNFSYSIDGGVSYLATPNLQLDVFGGWLGERNWFAEIGVSWRYSFLKAIAKKKVSGFLGGK